MSWKEVSDEMEKIEKIVGSMEEDQEEGKKSGRRERVQIHQRAETATRGKAMIDLLIVLRLSNVLNKMFTNIIFMKQSILRCATTCLCNFIFVSFFTNK